jgi:ubiquinone/menaquinone biosynthesis C-methylase UbiE
VFTKSEEFYDAVYSWKDYEAESERLIALIGERNPGARTLLDVACGTGTHLARLALWYEVEGVDLDPKMLELARRKLPDARLEVADMISLELGRSFDVVTCLFSSIGYAGSVDNIRQAVAAMASHLTPGGVLVVEPWFTPEQWHPGRPHLLAIDEPDLKIARVTLSGQEGRTAILDFTYVVGTPEAVEVFTERHEAVLATDEQYREVFEAAGLETERDEQGLMGRGLWIGRRPG